MITDRIDPVSYKLLLPPHMHISPVFHVSLLRPVSPGLLSDEVSGVPGAIEIEGDSAFWVRKLVDSRRWRGQLQYLVDWEGYSPEEWSCVPVQDILSQDLVDVSFRVRLVLGCTHIPPLGHVCWSGEYCNKEVGSAELSGIRVAGILAMVFGFLPSSHSS